MTTTSYLVAASAVMGGGAVLGYVSVFSFAAADGGGGLAGDGARPRARERTGRRWRRRPSVVQVIGAVVLLLSGWSVYQGWKQSEDNAAQTAEIERQAAENKRLTECLRAYSDGLATALKARSAASDEAQLAEDTLFETLLTTPPTAAGREAARTAFTDYVRRRADARAERELHPLPETPRVTC